MRQCGTLRLEALPVEVLQLILDFSRPTNFDSLAATCKTIFAAADYHMKEHKQCKRIIAQMSASARNTRLRLLVSPPATLYWLCHFASSHPMEQLRYVDILRLQFPPRSSGHNLGDALALARLMIPNLHRRLQEYARDIWEAISGHIPLGSALELSTGRFVDAGFPFNAPMLCQLALIGFTYHATVLIITKAYLVYMNKPLERILTGRPGGSFLREVKELWIGDRNYDSDFDFSSCAMSVLSRLPQLQAVMIENLRGSPVRSKFTEYQAPQSGRPSLNATVLVLFDTIWTPDAAIHILSLFPKLRSFVWRSRWHSHWSSPSADPFNDDDTDDPDELEDYADWFQTLRADHYRRHPLAAQLSNGSAEVNDLHPVRTNTQTGYRGRGRGRGSLYNHRSHSMRHTSRSSTYQQLARDADSLISDKSFESTDSDGDLDLDESDKDGENPIPCLNWQHPDPFQPSLLLNALCQNFGNQLEHLAISVFGSIQAAAQIARRNTVVHFLHLHKLTHLDLDTRILRPRKGSVYQYVSLHRLLPPSMRQLALTVLHCFLSAQLRTLLGQLPLNKSSQPQLMKIFVRILMSDSRVATSEDESCCEDLRRELARVNIDFEWVWIDSSVKVKPGLDWNDSSDIMPLTYSMKDDQARF